MLIFILFVMVILIGGYFAFRYVEQVRPSRKITKDSLTNFEVNEEIHPNTGNNNKGEVDNEAANANAQKKTVKYANWENDPPIYLNVNQPHIHFLMKDPDWIFCYWHWGLHTAEEFNSNHGENAWNNSTPVIRYHELDNGNFFDITTNDYAHTWYVKVNRRNVPLTLYLGRLLNGNFIHLATSNKLVLPLGSISPNIDPLWQPVSGLMPAASDADLGGLSSPELLTKN